MIDPGFLTRAVSRGIITAEQSDALVQLAGESGSAGAETGSPTGVDDERFRLVTGFADIFVGLSIALFLGATWMLGSQSFGPAATWILIAALAWGLAEFFTRRRRMALPSLILLAVFAGASFAGAAEWLGFPEAGLFAVPAENRTSGTFLVLAGAAFCTLVLVGLHYRRFAVPITVAAAAAALAGLVLALVNAVLPAIPEAAMRALIVLAGLAVFLLGMRFDLADPSRTTRRADIAFWLHLLAAPMIVHPALWGVNEALATGTAPKASALSVLGAVLVLTLVALAIDRRALLVAGLVYTGFALSGLLQIAGITGLTIPLTLFALGAFVLLLSAGWHALRGLVLRSLPPRLAARLPHSIGMS